MKRTVLVVTLVLMLSVLSIAPALAAGPGHQRAAADLKGEMADVMPDHVVGEQPGAAHQSYASFLKGDVAGFHPDHVRP